MSLDPSQIQTIERTRVAKYDKTHEDDPQTPHEIVTVTALNGKTALRTVTNNGEITEQFQDENLIAKIAALELGPQAIEQHHQEAVKKLGASDGGGPHVGD